MNNSEESLAAWGKVRCLFDCAPSPCTIRIPRGNIPHPRDAGARPTVTWPVGQVADYSLTITAGEAPLIIREFIEYWEVSLATAAVPAKEPAVGSQHDATPALVAGAAIVGGIIGASLSNKKGAALLGAGIGALVAVTLSAIEQEEDSKINAQRRGT